MNWRKHSACLASSARSASCAFERSPEELFGGAAEEGAEGFSSSSGCSGVRGTRIRVEEVAIWHERLGLSLDEIARRFPQLTPAAIEAALAYFQEHRDEIQLQVHSADSLANQLGKRQPSHLAERTSQAK
jgi:uncharacterized protein (DUF433 family)